MNFTLRLLTLVIAWLLVAILIGSIGVALLGVLFGALSQYAALLVEAYISITEGDVK